MKINGKRLKSNPYFRKPYQTWKNMIERCCNPSNAYYKNYGAKGVTVCERWKVFENFLEDYDKIKGFSEDIFTRRDIFLDKDGEDLKNTQYNLENCEFIDITTSNKRKQHQMKRFKVTNNLTGEEYLYINQSECSRDLGIKQSNISKALHNKSGQCGKYKNYSFEFVDL